MITGVCLTSIGKQVGFSDTAHVTFGTLSEDEIDYYVNAYSPMDKAGAYRVQEWIGYMGVERIEGSYYNVMGLPIFKSLPGAATILKNKNVSCVLLLFI